LLLPALGRSVAVDDSDSLLAALTVLSEYGVEVESEVPAQLPRGVAGAFLDLAEFDPAHVLLADSDCVGQVGLSVVACAPRCGDGSRFDNLH
jgi:hypothetical protein